MSTLLERLEEAEIDKANPDEGEGFSEESISQLEELAPKVPLETMQEVVAV